MTIEIKRANGLTEIWTGPTAPLTTDALRFMMRREADVRLISTQEGVVYIR